MLLLMTTAIVGCIGNKDAPTLDKSSTTNTTALNSTVAPDGRGMIEAFNETNKTETTGIGAMAHTHDYWGGKERLDNVMWVNSGLIPFPIVPCKRADNGCSLGSSTPGTDTYPPLTTIADYDFAAPPRMGMVYEGTKTVEIKMTKFAGPSLAPDPVPAPPGNPTGQVFFDYLAANDEPGKFRHGGELKLNEPLKIDIKPTDADMPHQTKSLWLLRIYSNTNMGWFEFNITVSLVKGYDVVNWPPHPDLYADRKDRIVTEGPIKIASKGSIDGVLFGSDAGWTNPQRVISWGTDSVDVEFTNVAFNGQVPVPPKGFVMEYRNASTPFLMANGVAYGGRMSDPGSDGKSYHFTIDITKDRGDAMDTPYAQYSRWGFRLVPYWEDTGVGMCVDELVFPGLLFGCQWYPWEMAYTLKVTAHGHSTASGVPASTV